MKEKMLDSNLWEMHLSRQFNWTLNFRKNIYGRISLPQDPIILDAGCGIGLIAKEIHENFKGEIHGIDINSKMIKKAQEKFPEGKFITGNVMKLPYPDKMFDCVFCHFLLMWVKDPAAALSEMIRVTKPQGWIVCASEPDYGAKIDYPDQLNAAASTIRAIQAEGADPYFGRKLKGVFAKCGLKPQTGVFAELWDDETMKREFEHVWKFSEMTAQNSIMKKWVQSVREKDLEALEKGERITFLPIFWSIAQKP